MSLGRFPGESAFSTPERVLSRREKLERMEQLLASRERMEQQLASPGLTPSQRAATKVLYEASKRRLDATTIGVLGQQQGIDLTQVGTPPGTPPGYFRPVTAGQFEGARRNLSGYLNRVGDPITTGHSDTTLPAIDASSILGTPGTVDTPPQSSIFGPDVTLGATPGGPSVGQLDDTDTPMSAADVHGAALDAMGSIDRGNVAATGVDLDSTAHMDDIARGLGEITTLLRTLVQRQAYNTPGTDMPDAQPDFDDSLVQMTRGTRPDQRRGARGTSERALLPGESRNVPNEEESDEPDDANAETTDDDDPSTDEENEPVPAPAPAPEAAQAGSGAVAVSRQLDVEARAEAAEALRRAPGIMKLIEARVFKFDDFLTNGNLDPQKLAKVRRVLAKRVDSSAESYKLAAKAKGYAPSGAAFPIEGLNNIVGGVRKIPGSKYVMYQGPQYVNG